MGRVGVAISTRNRRAQFLAVMPHWMGHFPANGALVVVDDASEEPLQPFLGATVVRQNYQRGVAMTKNRGIAELVELGCDHLFLVDDDVFPRINNWWEPYVNSPEPHLSHQWEGRRPWNEVHNDGTHFSIGFPRGVMLYAERSVIDKVGGMDPAHGVWGGEHVEWSQRIHDAGLTTWPYADVCESSLIWYAHDREVGNTVGSSLPLAERQRLARDNGLQWQKPRPRFVPYWERTSERDYGPGPIVKAKTRHALLKHVVGLSPHGVALTYGASHEASRIITKRMGQCRGYAHSAKQAGLIYIDCDSRIDTRNALLDVEKDCIRHLQPGAYVILSHHRDLWTAIAERRELGWTVVGSDDRHWAIRIT